MSQWAGFSDADLRKLQQQTDSADDFPRLSYKPSNDAKIKSSGVARSKPATGRDKMLSFARHSGSPPGDINPDQMLSKPKTNKPRTNSAAKMNKNKETSASKEQEKNSKTSTKKTDSPLTENSDNMSEKDDPPNKEVLSSELDEHEGISRELMSLDKFRLKQKEIEEANKMKQKMLFSAIQERQKKTKAEAVKLQKIQKELALLDKITTEDVSVIRDKIEDVSREFMDAQRRYDRAEKEFVEAKIELQKKLESKENLTDHLYTIIQQNEMRKARKLGQLMQQLEMSTAAQDEEETDMAVPQLTIITAAAPDPFHHHTTPDHKAAPPPEPLHNQAAPAPDNNHSTKPADKPPESVPDAAPSDSKPPVEGTTSTQEDAQTSAQAHENGTSRKDSDKQTAEPGMQDDSAKLTDSHHKLSSDGSNT